MSDTRLNRLGVAPEFDLLVVGGAGIDTIIRVPELPPAYSDSVMVEPIESYVAHTGTGVALGSRALGLRVKFVDLIGDDEHGARIVSRFAAEGLDFSWLPSERGTRRAVNLVSPDGRRMSFYDARDVPGQRIPESFYEPWLASSRHVHVSIADFARHVLLMAQRLGIPVSTDLHAWDGVNEHHKDFAYGADLVFLSAANLGDRWDAVVAEIFDLGRASLVVVTDGARGAYLAHRTDCRFYPAATPPSAVVDSNGAGDAFVAGFLSGRLRGEKPDSCMRRGLIAGAFTCTVHGTAERFPSEADLSAGRDSFGSWPSPLSSA